MPDDYRDYLMRPYGRDPGEIRPYDVAPPAPPVDVTPAEALALALGWQPVYFAPLAPPARWIAPDGTGHATLPAWETLLAEVAYWRGEVGHYQTAAATLLARVRALEAELAQERAPD